MARPRQPQAVGLTIVMVTVVIGQVLTFASLACAGSSTGPLRPIFGVC